MADMLTLQCNGHDTSPKGQGVLVGAAAAHSRGNVSNALAITST